MSNLPLRDFHTSQLQASIARNVIPGGSQTMSKSPGAFPGDYPLMLERGLGQNVCDSDGNWYTDWICGLGTNGLGMSHYGVNTAAIKQIQEGTSFSLPTMLESVVAEKLTDLIPCAEMVRFTKTGSEACAGAIRIARAVTGRPVIAVCGYHGWHDWYAASMPQHPGVPSDLERMVRAFQYNDTTSLRRVLDGSVAAVIMEPVLHESPQPGFLAECKRLAEQVGALFILDENVTGFRADLRGAQHLYGVTPDLAVFGKALSNGFPLAAIVGRKDLMQNCEYISGTFGGEAVSLAAASATIDIYKDTGCINKMHEIGSMLRIEVSAVLKHSGLYMDGMRWKPRIRSFDDKILATFVQGMAKRGHLIHPKGFYISCAHTEEDVRDFANCASVAQYDNSTNVQPPKGTAWLRS